MNHKRVLFPVGAPPFAILKTAKCGPYLQAETNPRHPKADYRGRYLHHRIVMENALGRLLGEAEVVHHRDRNGHNNSIENLQILTPSEHSKHHAKTAELAQVVCGYCRKCFHLMPYLARKRKKASKTGLMFCSKRCQNTWAAPMNRWGIHTTGGAA